jgi:hypothetical protein
MSQLNRIKAQISTLMKGAFCSAIIWAIALFGWVSSVNGQGLLISNFVMPDTVYMNSSVPVQFSITNAQDTSILGNLQLFFRNETFNNVEGTLGGFEAVQFFAPMQERNFATFMPIEPQYFLEGGNTVVIWPSMAGQEIPNDSLRKEVFVYFASSVEGENALLSRDYIIPNPVSDKLIIKPRNKAEMPKSIAIYDQSGRLILENHLESSGIMDISMVPAGIIMVKLGLSDGKSHITKMVKIVR